MSTPTDSTTTARSIAGAGTGDFTFEGPGALGGRPVRVWYDAPAGDLASAQILIVMPGTRRDGEAYRADWLPLLPGHHTLLLVPEFSDKEYPGVNGYNLGNMLSRQGKPTAKESWSFNMIEALFDRVVADTGSSATSYDLFGHSAGAQFVHRFVEFMPKSRVAVAVAANAGWYTVLDDSVRFPYGFKGAPLRIKQMKPAFARDLIVLLGADDIDPKDPSLQRDRRTDAQGHNRLSRGLNFYETAREAAGTSMPFNWRLIVVPGIAHSHQDMAAVAAPLLLEPGGMLP